VDEVRRLRQEKGWSQNELAYHAKLAPSVISLIETGKRDPNATTLRKLADALDVRIPDLFEESGSRKARRRSSHEPTLNDALDERRETETAEKLLRFGGRMVAWWESELPKRLEDEDEEWLRHTWTMYHEFIDILNSVRPGESSNKQELLASLMDINAAANRILEMVHKHNERSLEAGKKVLVLEEIT
jgi:transcriptional regulator with XRE-family HTH domain